MADDPIVWRIENGILWILFNRPKKKNAMHAGMYRLLTQALRKAEKDDSIIFSVVTECIYRPQQLQHIFFCCRQILATRGMRTVQSDEPDFPEFCLIMRVLDLHQNSGYEKSLCSRRTPLKSRIVSLPGRGDCFSSGNDFKIDTSPAAADSFYNLIGAVIDHPKPLIALVNGPAFGMAVTILGLFDLVIASDTASFKTPFSELGLCPEGCSSVTFPSIMGHSKACEMLMFNETFDACQALQSGLVNKVINYKNFKEEATEFVTKLARFPKESMNTTKRLMRTNQRAELHSANQRECENVKRLWGSDETQKMIQLRFGIQKAKM